MAKHIDYNHPLRWRGKSASRSWAMYANDVWWFKPTHQHRVEGLIDPDWVIVERIHYNKNKYYEYWITHDNESFWVYQSLTSAREAEKKYPRFKPEPEPQPVPVPALREYNTSASCTCPASKYRPQVLCKHIRFYLDPIPVDPEWKCGEGPLKNIYMYDVKLKCDCPAYTYNSNKPCKHLRALGGYT